MDLVTLKNIKIRVKLKPPRRQTPQTQEKLRRVKKLPFKIAKRLNNERKLKGKAALAFIQDVENATENDAEHVYINMDELEEEEIQVCYANSPSDDEDQERESSNQTRDESHDEPHRRYCRFEPEMPGNSDTSAAFKCESLFQTNSITFILDTGSTDHICNDIRALRNIQKFQTPKRITCANGSSDADLLVLAKGDIMIGNNLKQTIGCLKNVLYAPKLVDNLFSLRKLMSNNVHAIFTNKSVEIIDPDDQSTMSVGSFDGRFWKLTFTLPNLACSDIGSQNLGGKSQTRLVNLSANRKRGSNKFVGNLVKRAKSNFNSSLAVDVPFNEHTHENESNNNISITSKKMILDSNKITRIAL